MSKPENPPAFPAHDYVVGNINDDQFQKLGNTRGMTLRDYFAGQALIGLLSNHMPMASNLPQEELVKKTVIFSFKIAEAMLQERLK